MSDSLPKTPSSFLQKVISGGQNGVDQAALRAAKACGIATGGWAPKGFRTLDGPKPELQELYGLQESDSPEYPPRTAKNVHAADYTLRFARNWGSGGEKCTLRVLTICQRPYLDITVGVGVQFRADSLAGVLQSYKPAVLNVAGNSESTAPGIGLLVECFLIEVFKHLGYHHQGMPE